MPQSGELRIDARSGSFGIAADRLFRLDRGYKLAIRMAEPVPANATVELAAVCGNSERTKLARIVLAPGKQAGEAAVPAGACAFADLQLSFTVNPGRQDALFRVASIAMSPSRGLRPRARRAGLPPCGGLSVKQEKWSGREDSNLRPLPPEDSALPG